MTDPVQDKFVTPNSLRFHYRDWDDARAPVIVALHGSTSNSHGWDTTARALCDRPNFYSRK